MSPVKSKIPKGDRPFLDRLLDEVRYRLTTVEEIDIAGKSIPRYVGEFWTSQQRQALSLHEISYRACFKPQLPRFFIEHLSNEGDTVYDPFSGRGTTALEAGLLNRNIIANDANPLSTPLCKPRFFPPVLADLMERLDQIPIRENAEADIDLSMVYHPRTESEIVSLKEYFDERRGRSEEDHLDRWIQMVATNRLAGHSKGFFSFSPLPPHQAVSAASQRKITLKAQQEPEHRDTRVIIFKKSKTLLSGVSPVDRQNLQQTGTQARFLTCDARETKAISSGTVQLTVTSPPFLDAVDYVEENWLRCWFNNLDPAEAAKAIPISRSLDEWSAVMFGVFRELYRVTKPRGFVAFEVGEARNKEIKLDEHVVPLGVKAGFSCVAIIKNQNFSNFTATKQKHEDSGFTQDVIVIFRK
ncbi:MAG: site-specific DNA-methyltransferase [Ignavibacteriae bacterium]|nr:MAG: site-specific DNA-methyltransferase [Ignavibacteriota bacterium]